MDKKAIRILIVGGQGTGKTTLSLELARIMVNNAISVTVVDDGDAQPFRAEFDNSDEYPINTIAVYPTVRAAVRAMPVPSSMIIDLREGSIRYGLDGLPDELRQPIMNAATEQINWVNERFPMRNGRVAFRAECEMSEEDKKKLIETSTRKEGGEVERTLTSNDEAVTEALKKLAQDLAKIAKRKQKRRQIYRYIRATLIIMSAAFFVLAGVQIGVEGGNFLYTLSFAFATGVLSNLFTNG